jgi:hypothetical protein
VTRKEFGHLRNQLRRKSPARERNRRDQFDILGRSFSGSRQRDAAMFSGRIDGEQKHEENYLNDP